MICPWCQQYSLVYDWERNTWTCAIYNGETRDEDHPRWISNNMKAGV